MMALTYFKSKLDNDPSGKTLKFSDWEALTGYLEELSRHRGKKPKMGEPITPDCSPLISPAMFKPGEKRRKDSVVGWAGWAALDIDDFQGDVKDFDNRGYECMIYSTASSRIDRPAFRVVVPLTKWIKNERVPDFWYSLNMHYLGIGDPQAKDTCRIYYVPAKYPDAHNFTTRMHGDWVDPDRLIANYPMPKLFKRRMIDRIPLEMQKAVHAERHQVLVEQGVNLDWTSYKDCPFVNMNLVEDYFNNETKGWYGKLFSIMVSIASIAEKKGYEITENEIADIAKEIDEEDGGYYTNRDFRSEARNAIKFARGQS